MADPPWFERRPSEEELPGRLALATLACPRCWGGEPLVLYRTTSGKPRLVCGDCESAFDSPADVAADALNDTFEWTEVVGLGTLLDVEDAGFDVTDFFPL